jgi:hypothetical protein
MKHRVINNIRATSRAASGPWAVVYCPLLVSLLIVRIDITEKEGHKEEEMMEERNVKKEKLRKEIEENKKTFLFCLHTYVFRKLNLLACWV